MSLIGTKAAASAQGFGEFLQAGSEPVYIESVFSTYLYNGNGSTQTITNGIDLAGKGGLVWGKARNFAVDHVLIDTARGAANYLSSNNTLDQQTALNGLTAFNSTGFSVGSSNILNSSTRTFASWTFRKQPKFFDVVTYTGTGSVQNISHSLGSAPGFIIVKSTNGAGDWWVYHRSLGATQRIQLNDTFAASSNAAIWNNTEPTSTVFTVGASSASNNSGTTYVAYLFAHNAGGFGLTGTDNVITCGSYTGNGSTTGPEINLGYEPQRVMIKNASGTGNWRMLDVMRGMDVSGTGPTLSANLSDAEATANSPIPTATGFRLITTNSNFNTNGSTYIYIAIRRGPMKTPTSGTSVFSPVAQASFNPYSVGFPTDLAMGAIRGGNALNTAFGDRLRGGTQYLVSSSTAAEANDPGGLFYFDQQNSMDQGLSSASSIFWNFRRAPGFFDEVCYTGTGANLTLNHNLGVAPELIISKARSTTSDWGVYLQLIGDNGGQGLILNGITALGTYNPPITTANTTTFQARATNFGSSGTTYVAYLFASCPGVSKVGSYTGNGSTQTINCGFTGGARFVLIKRTDSTGDWYVYDTARGMTTLTDPYLRLNSTAAESATLGSVTTVSTGFALNASILAAINTNSASYIFWAVA